ncbi:MAG TPA: DUF4912 domain-containing protein [Pyrinomonadaceae bacterium]|nr:DUF4912 domain-containing protein [Pyrinomonadaceae bacterium]
MPFFFPGSSELVITQETPSPAVVDKLAELSADEPLPESYDLDRISLLAQSPRRIYLYWELARDPFEPLQRVFGQRDGYRLAVRLTDMDSEATTLHEASGTRSQWFDVQPDRAYMAELGLYSPGRPFIRLLASNTRRTPRASVSLHTEQAEQWQVTAEQFSRVLDDAGYVSDALEVALEAADEATNNAATRAITRRLAPASLPPMSEEELAELRGVLTALAFGMPWGNLRPMLSQDLATWFDRFGADGAQLDPARITEVLHSTLGIEMTRSPFEAPPEAARRRAARVIVGASEVNLPSRPFHLWMPSMTERQVRRQSAE